MSGRPVSRRGFLKIATAGGAAAAAGSLISFDEWKQEAYAEDETKVLTKCGCCAMGCALRVGVKNGRLSSVEGVPEDPVSGGHPCARGYAWTDVAYATEGRVTSPMKRNDDGSYSEISWDQAFQEIAQKLHEVVDAHGAKSVAYCAGCGATQGFYGQRFINAIGSSNTYGVTGACKVSHDTAWILTAGGEPSTDLANADYVIFIGRSPADGINTGQLNLLSKKHAAGETHYIVVDPRLNSTSPLVDEWLPIKPGTDLAFLLALSNVVVEEGLYDKDFVKKHTTGFDEYAKALKKYTPEWAEGVTEIPAKTITRIAREIATAKHGVIEHGFRGGLGVAYANNIQTTRVLALFDALLGTYNKKGGLITAPGGVALGTLDPKRFETPQVEDNPYGHDKYPIPPAHEYLTNVIPVGADKGDLHAAFYYGTNPVLSHGNPERVSAELQKLDLLVTIDLRWSETAAISDYVLPDTTYLEQNMGVRATGSNPPTVYEMKQAIDTVNPNTKSAPDIFRGLADAYGVGKYFKFTDQDRKDAALAPLGKTSDDLDKAEILTFPKQSTDLSVGVVINTESGKIDFASDAYEKIGYGRVPGWIPPKVEPDDDSFRVIAGNNPNQSHTYNYLSPTLRQVTEDEVLDRVWINAAKAQELGIAEGDDVEIYSDKVSRTTKAHVTQGINPHALFISSNYGSHEQRLGAAADSGIAFMDFTSGELDPNSASALTQENSVKIRKVVA